MNNYYDDQNNNEYFEQEDMRNDDFSNFHPEEEQKPKKKIDKKKAGLFGGGAVCGILATALVCGCIAAGNTQTTSAQVAETATMTAKDAEDTTTQTTSSVAQTETSGETLSVEQVAEKAMPSMVTITCNVTTTASSFFGEDEEIEGEAAGTGVIIDSNDDEVLIVTNNHVVTGANSVTVGFNDGQEVSATVKGTDSGNDLALVSVKVSDIPADTLSAISVASIGSSSDLALGEEVVAIGNALGEGQSLTTGCVSAFDKELQLEDSNGQVFTSSGLIQTDASINSGNSGGGLFNMKGELIGINEAKASSSYGEASVDNMGYAIPTDKAMPLIESLKTLTSREEVDEENAGALGVMVSDVSSDATEAYGIPTGACISSLVEGGAAEAAGLQVGDVITSFDGISISSRDDLVNTISYYAQGETVDVTVQRANNGVYEEQVISVTLGAASDLQDSTEQTQTEDQQSQDEQDPYSQYDDGSDGDEDYSDEGGYDMDEEEMQEFFNQIQQMFGDYGSTDGGSYGNNGGIGYGYNS